MATASEIAKALASLHKEISFEKAGTSREERMAIMESASRALQCSGDSFSTNQFEYLRSLFPVKAGFSLSQEEAGREEDQSAMPYFFTIEMPPVFLGEGSGSSPIAAVEDSIRRAILTSGLMFRILQNGGTAEQIAASLMAVFHARDR